MITENNISILLVLYEYYVLTRPQIQRLVYPDHKQGRSTRKQLAKLLHAGYVYKTKTLIPLPHMDSACPVYWLSPKGTELLANYFDDEKFLSANTRRPRADLLFHWIGISENHIRIQQAISRQQYVQLLAFVHEWQIVNPADGSNSGFYLHTVLREQPPLTCSPDAGFVLNVADVAKAFYLEVDRNTSGVKQIASSKTLGYDELARQGCHRAKHFPMATFDEFSIVMVTTHEGRCKRLSKAISEKPGAHRWLFCTQDDFQPENVLFEPIMVDCGGQRRSLVKKPNEQSKSA